MLAKLLKKALTIAPLRNFIIKIHHAKRRKSLEKAKIDAMDIKNSTGRKSMVFLVGSEYKALTKQQIKAAKRGGAFKKIGITQIEKQAMFITK